MDEAVLVRRVACGLGLAVIAAAAAIGYTAGGASVGAIAGVIGAIGGAVNVVVAPRVYRRWSSVLGPRPKP
jgi:hypothetical protein